ncbi:TMEM175 family protein [Bradyrhizobium sp. HKCCYLS2038]|uniref:TMEM175 family protein n=1 Tax=unclassified Bradyrhizobium TaxID=2631580 RepID=UPI003EBDD1B3
MFSKARLDTLSDSIFGVAMTLLALDVRLPDDFHPRDAHQLLDGIANLWPKFFPYVLSFAVLGLRWLSNAQMRSRADDVPQEYVRWCLLYLMLITFVPFTTTVVGRFAHFAPAIWLYAGHTLLIALISWRMITVTPHLEPGDQLRDRQVWTAMLIAASSVLAILVSFFNPPQSLWAFALTSLAPFSGSWDKQQATAD